MNLQNTETGKNYTYCLNFKHFIKHRKTINRVFKKSELRYLEEKEKDFLHNKDSFKQVFGKSPPK